MEAVPISKTKTTQSPYSFLRPEATQLTKQVSQLLKIFKAYPTERNLEKLSRCQQNPKRQRGIWCNKLAEMRSTEIWREIRKIKGSTPTFQTVNLKLEDNRLADYFTTRTDQTILPKKSIKTPKQQLPLRQSNLTATKQKHPDTNRLFTFHELETMLRIHRKTAI